MTRGGIVLPNKQVTSNLKSWILIPNWWSSTNCVTTAELFNLTHLSVLSHRMESQLTLTSAVEDRNRKLTGRNIGILTRFYTNFRADAGRLEDMEQEPRQQQQIHK